MIGKIHLNLIGIYNESVSDLRHNILSKLMVSKQVTQQKAFLVFIFLMFYQILFAQTEIQPLLAQQDSVQLKKFRLFDDLSVFPVPGMGENWFFSPASPALNNLQSDFDFGKKQPPKTISVAQNKIETVLPNLGSIEHFTNQFRWKAGNRVAVDFGAGLALQNTIMNPIVPNYQLSFRASVEYSFNDWLSAYLYGQYITKPLNQADDYLDPFMHNNPLFLQNEIGAGMKANFNKTHIGFEIYSMPCQEFKSPLLRPSNSRITIGF